MRASHLAGRITLAAALVLTGRSAAFAQNAAADAGPLVLSPIPTSIVFSPEAKVTTIDGRTAVLAGASIGRLVEHTVYVGGAWYGLATPRDDARLWYGGVLVGVRIYGGENFNLSARSLFGLGQGSVFDTISFVELPRHGMPPSGMVRVRRSDDFAVLEPELRAVFGITDALSLNLGAGYRATTAYRGLDEVLHGATGTVGIQFNLGN